MSFARLSSVLFLSFTLQACAHASLSKAASAVQVTYGKPDASCKVLGTVEGNGGGLGLGRYVSNTKLLQYATNDARNKAAAMGATHIEIVHKNYGLTDGTVSSAMIGATAYLCQ